MAAEPADVWTESKNIQLIREFRKRPILWDQKNHMFYKKEFKEWAWVEVSKVVKMPVEKCTRKIAILMSSFRREKAKMVNALKNATDPAEAYQSSWYGYKELTFLLDKDRERKLHSTGNTDNEEGKKPRILKKKSSLPAVHNTVEKKIKKTHTPPTVHHKVEHPKQLRPSLENDDYDMIQQPIKVTDNTVLKTYSRKLITTPQSNDNEIKFFANFIASKMMKYSEPTKNAAQKAICEVIFKADQNYNELNVNKPADPLHQPSGSVELPDNGFMKVYFSDSD